MHSAVWSRTCPALAPHSHPHHVPSLSRVGRQVAVPRACGCFQEKAKTCTQLSCLEGGNEGVGFKFLSALPLPREGLLPEVQGSEELQNWGFSAAVHPGESASLPPSLSSQRCCQSMDMCLCLQDRRHSLVRCFSESPTRLGTVTGRVQQAVRKWHWASEFLSVK